MTGALVSIHVCAAAAPVPATKPASAAAASRLGSVFIRRLRAVAGYCDSTGHHVGIHEYWLHRLAEAGVMIKAWPGPSTGSWGDQ